MRPPRDPYGNTTGTFLLPMERRRGICDYSYSQPPLPRCTQHACTSSFSLIIPLAIKPTSHQTYCDMHSKRDASNIKGCYGQGRYSFSFFLSFLHHRHSLSMSALPPPTRPKWDYHKSCFDIVPLKTQHEGDQRTKELVGLDNNPVNGILFLKMWPNGEVRSFPPNSPSSNFPILACP